MHTRGKLFRAKVFHGDADTVIAVGLEGAEKTCALKTVRLDEDVQVHSIGGVYGLFSLRMRCLPELLRCPPSL